MWLSVNENIFMSIYYLTADITRIFIFILFDSNRLLKLDPTYPLEGSRGFVDKTMSNKTSKNSTNALRLTTLRMQKSLRLT